MIENKDIEIKNQLFDIIEKHTSIKKENLDFDTEILNGLGCSGDDAYDMLEEVCVTFEINCKEFHPYDVCDLEANNYLYSAFNPKYLYCLIFDSEKTRFPKFTIGMLLDAVKSKRLKSIKPKGYYYAKEVVTN